MRTFHSWQPTTADGSITVHDARATALKAGELVEVARDGSSEVFEVTAVGERSFTCALAMNSN